MNVPKLRFNEFQSQWNHKKIAEIMQKVSCPVDVELNRMYQQIGIRSHGKGLFHKEPVSGASLGNKRIFWLDENLFLVNIVFAWEQAVAKTTPFENGMVASHRFPMYKPKENLSATDYILHFFLTDKGKYYLGLASPGGAGRNKTLGQKNFEELVLIVPEVEEQTKIANFLTAIDEKISQLTQKYDLLKQYKKGVMQRIFSQKLRFKDDGGREFPEWDEKELGDVTEIIMGQSPDSNSYNDLAAGKPLIQGNADISNRKTNPRAWTITPTKECKVNDIILTVRAPVGAVAISYHNACIGRGVCAIRSKKETISSYVYQLLLWFEPTRWVSLEQGSTFTAVSSKDIKTIDVPFPTLPEQTKIANFLTAIDDKITHTKTQLDAVKLYKKGLLQQMFV